MKIASEVVVTGIKRSKGSFEGVEFDSTKFYVETDLDDSKGNSKGKSVVEYSMGDSKEYDKYSHLSFPFKAAAEMEIVSTGKVTKVALVALKPVALVQAGKAA